MIGEITASAAKILATGKILDSNFNGFTQSGTNHCVRKRIVSRKM